MTGGKYERVGSGNGHSNGSRLARVLSELPKAQDRAVWSQIKSSPHPQVGAMGDAKINKNRFISQNKELQNAGQRDPEGKQKGQIWPQLDSDLCGLDCLQDSTSSSVSGVTLPTPTPAHLRGQDVLTVSG